VTYGLLRHRRGEDPPLHDRPEGGCALLAELTWRDDPERVAAAQEARNPCPATLPRGMSSSRIWHAMTRPNGASPLWSGLCSWPTRLPADRGASMPIFLHTPSSLRDTRRPDPARPFHGAFLPPQGHLDLARVGVREKLGPRSHRCRLGGHCQISTRNILRRSFLAIPDRD